LSKVTKQLKLLDDRCVGNSRDRTIDHPKLAPKYPAVKRRQGLSSQTATNLCSIPFATSHASGQLTTRPSGCPRSCFGTWFLSIWRISQLPQHIRLHVHRRAHAGVCRFVRPIRPTENRDGLVSPSKSADGQLIPPRPPNLCAPSTGAHSPALAPSASSPWSLYQTARSTPESPGPEQSIGSAAVNMSLHDVPAPWAPAAVGNSRLTFGAAGQRNPVKCGPPSPVPGRRGSKSVTSSASGTRRKRPERIALAQPRRNPGASP